MSTFEAEGRERALRRLARTASGGVIDALHVDEPLLALLRHGDHGDDIADAIAHVARCVDCRARLALGDVAGRNVVVMAIEAPRASSSHLLRVTEASGARLGERGQGRWTAVVDADKAERLKGELVSGDTSVVSRLVMTPPLRVAREEIVQGRKTMSSVHDVAPTEPGTNAAEVEAWAKIPRAPRKNVPEGGPGWALFAVFAVLGAVAIAYMLAIR